MEYSLEECINQEAFTIKILEAEQVRCESCRIDAIDYHKAVLVYLKELERRFLDEESGN